MEISEKELRRSTADVDDQHRSGLASIGADIAELHSGEGRRLMEPSRRRFLKGAGLTGAVTIGSVVLPMSRLWSPAFAQTGDPNKAIAAFAESVELAAVAAYQAAAKTGKVSGAGLTTAQTFAQHHQDHAQAFGGYAGDSSKAQPNPGLVKAIAPQIQSAPDAASIVKIAYGLENAAAATYLYALGALTDPAAQKLTASILPVESQHAVVWGHVLGQQLGDTGDFIPAFLNDKAALSPTQYPIQPGT